MSRPSTPRPTWAKTEPARAPPGFIRTRGLGREARFKRSETQGFGQRRLAEGGSVGLLVAGALGVATASVVTVTVTVAVVMAWAVVGLGVFAVMLATPGVVRGPALAVGASVMVAVVQAEFAGVLVDPAAEQVDQGFLGTAAMVSFATLGPGRRWSRSPSWRGPPSRPPSSRWRLMRSGPRGRSRRSSRSRSRSRPSALGPRSRTSSRRCMGGRSRSPSRSRSLSRRLMGPRSRSRSPSPSRRCIGGRSRSRSPSSSAWARVMPPRRVRPPRIAASVPCVRMVVPRLGAGSRRVMAV